jgi:hypothetical protein
MSECEKFMTNIGVDHITAIKINGFCVKARFRALTGELDMRVAMGRIAPSRKTFTAQMEGGRHGFCSDSSLSPAKDNTQPLTGCRLPKGAGMNLLKVMLRVESGLCMVLIINAEKICSCNVKYFSCE